MTRNKVLKQLALLLEEDNVIFYIGKYICRECVFKTEGTLFIEDEYMDGISLALGVAMGTEKKVIVVLEDKYLLQYLNSMTQVAISKCTNLFFLCLKTDRYCPTIQQNTVTNSLRAFSGILFNMGMLAHNYSKYFETITDIKKLKNIYLSTIGPVIGIVSISNNRIFGKQQIHDFDITSFIKFVNRKQETKEENKDILDLDKVLEEG